MDATVVIGSLPRPQSRELTAALNIRTVLEQLRHATCIEEMEWKLGPRPFPGVKGWGRGRGEKEQAR
eukprot:7376462-Prymnesium_polylepis.2